MAGGQFPLHKGNGCRLGSGITPALVCSSVAEKDDVAQYPTEAVAACLLLGFLEQQT